MTSDHDPGPHDPLTSSLSAYDDSLAAGAAPSAAELPPDLLERYERTRAALDLLERVYHRAGRAAGAPLPPGVPGTIGRFRIRSLLGQGGFGVVFLAEDPNLSRLVALKVPHASSLVDPRLRQRFLGEAEIMAGLSHPNIVRVHEAGEAGGLLYIACEHVRGPTLASWLKEKKPPTEDSVAARFVLTLARAVQFLHSRGVLHRDLKPSNVLLQEESPASPVRLLHPRITDFGLAKHLSAAGQETRTGAVVGTPGYAAPEQAEGRAEDVGAHTDVYALGAILYELLTGEPPCSPEGGPVRWTDVLHREPVPPSLLRPGVSRDLETVALKCLSKETSRRYSSTRELAEDLERLLDGRPVLARPVGAGERLVKWARRRPALAALHAITMASLITLAVLGWRMLQLAEERKSRERELQGVKKAADVDRFHSLVFQALEAMNSRPLGWTDQALTDLEEASRIETEARDSLRLRSLVARSLAGVDLRKAAEFAGGTDAFCLAYSPDGRHLAVGDRASVSFCNVLVYDLKTRGLVHTLSCRALSLAQSGVRALAYHPRRPWLAVGTRNGEVHRWDLSGPRPGCLSFQAHKDWFQPARQLNLQALEVAPHARPADAEAHGYLADAQALAPQYNDPAGPGGAAARVLDLAEGALDSIDLGGIEDPPEQRGWVGWSCAFAAETGPCRPAEGRRRLRPAHRPGPAGRHRPARPRAAARLRHRRRAGPRRQRAAGQGCAVHRHGRPRGGHPPPAGARRQRPRGRRRPRPGRFRRRRPGPDRRHPLRTARRRAGGRRRGRAVRPAQHLRGRFYRRARPGDRQAGAGGPLPEGTTC
jgi:hypothetical protein